jgi:hypothetical protein
MTARLLLPTLLVLAACGGAPPRSETGVAASAGSVVVTGRVADPGTKNSVLVFVYTDLAPNETVLVREPASVGTVGADGSFDLSVPPSGSLTMVFLADGRHDGAIDAGDAIATLNPPELADLQAGDHVQVSDAVLDFRAHTVNANVDVARAGAGEPARTPTPSP